VPRTLKTYWQDAALKAAFAESTRKRELEAEEVRPEGEEVCRAPSRAREW
jgi:hypothetical protein